MNGANIAWWAGYACVAIILQSLLPGIDFLLPGCIIAIQERRVRQLAWVTAFFLLLQEGMGSMAFGGTLLWYILAMIMFYLGYAIFEVENFLYIFLLSGCLAATHLGVLSLMAGLQDISLNMRALMDESVIQALVTPLLWRVAQPTRKWVHYEDRT